MVLIMICKYCRLVEDHTGDALASYAVAASGFLLPFAKASKRKFSVNIDEKLAPICCVGTQEIKNNMKLDATRLCKCNIQCIVVN
jgi:hypothetical protein